MPSKALVDTGCSQTIVARRLLPKSLPGSHTTVAVVGGGAVRCPNSHIELEIGNIVLNVEVLVMDAVVPAFDVLLGMDVITRLGGVTVTGSKATFDRAEARTIGASAATETPNCEDQQTPVLTVEERDFIAVFDGLKWTVSWKWLKGEPEPKNCTDSYAIPRDFEKSLRPN